MSELEAFRIIQGDTGGCGAPSYKCDTNGNRIEEWDDICEVYLKSEADKVIADLEESHKMEVEKLLIEIPNITRGAISMFKTSSCCRGFDLKSPLGKIANAAFKHWCYVESIQQKCINFERDKESSRQLIRELSHQKHKRCLDKAKLCENKLGTIVKPGWLDKWRRRWL